MLKLTLVPDTNVWRYIVDADATERVRLMAKRSGVSIVACPAVVYECLRFRDANGRRKLTEALTRNDWVRPMPEAFVEAEAVRSEIARLHPEWLLPNPDLTRYYRNREDWRSGFWRRVRQDPTRMADLVSRVQGNSIDRARSEAEALRTQARQLGHSDRSLRLNTAEARFVEPVPGWDGDPFEAWRAVSQAHWWDAAVLCCDDTAADWLSVWLDLRKVMTERAVWIRMWTREVETRRLPREWIRWAMREAQALRKVTAGTPVDNQIATYLVDYDVFLTSDRGFGQCVEMLRPSAPCRLAKVEIAPGGSASVGFVLDLLTLMSSQIRELPRRTSAGCPVVP